VDDSLASSDYYREPPRKAQRLKRKAMSGCGITVLHPVILQNAEEKNLKSYNLIFIDKSLKKLIGTYQASIPLRNGNLMMKCENIQQMSQLLNARFLSDGVKSVQIVTSVVQPAGDKRVNYRVPPDLKEEDLLENLEHQKVTYIKRFKNKDSGWSTTVFLQFSFPRLPTEVRVEYLLFKVKSCIPKPLRCFNCNRFGHVASNCHGKKRCSNCGGEHEWKQCSALVKCPNCAGEHSASDKICPRFTKESVVLKIKHTHNLTYAEACKQYSKTQVSASIPRFTNSDFPPSPELQLQSKYGHRSSSPCQHKL